MTIAEQVKLVFEKYPETKFDTADFMFKWAEEFLKVKYYMTDKQFKEFWKSEATLERTRRELLKDPQFKLPIEADKKRYDKADEFRQRLSPKEQSDYDYMFNEFE